MIVELCKYKTKCSSCKEKMRKGDIRGKVGNGWFNDPYLYVCLNCIRDKYPIPVNELVKIYKIKIKEYTKKIKALIELKKGVC